MIILESLTLAGEMAQEIKYLLCTHQDPSLGLHNLLKSDVVSNPNVPVVRSVEACG